MLLASIFSLIDLIFSVNDGTLQLDEDHVISTLKWAQNRINKLDDLVTPDLAFLWVVPKIIPDTKDQQYLGILLIRNIR